MLHKQWNLQPAPDNAEVQSLRRAINASDALAKILLQRSITDFETARRFFNPSVEQIHPPFLMKDMDRAVDRISKAIDNEENILVYGDYDVDGTTAVALLYSFLSNHYGNVTFYIPDRYQEGYGISTKGIDFAADNGITLMIALDCGIKAVDKVAYANELGIDFIICDHHLPGDPLPAAHAILNPLQADCPYPYKALSGCGIGFKLLQALLEAWSLEPSLAYHYIDLVAISTACDIVDMTGENRVLTHFGLKRLEQLDRPGLSMLLDNGKMLENGKLNRELQTTDLVFVIGPRINAAGRMDHGSAAVQLLIAEDKESAEGSVKRIVQNNTDRREVDLQTLDEALELAKTEEGFAQKKSTVLFQSNWHKGVIGIVASRMQDHYYRPTIMLTESNGVATGSARSVRGFDIHEAVASCSELLTSYGGHKSAAGMTLPVSRVEEFKRQFEASVAASISDEQLIPSMDLDVELAFPQITQRLYDQLQRLAPYGPGNMRPVFVTRGVVDAGRTRRVGDGTHLKMDMVQQGHPQHHLAGIAFGLGEHGSRIQSGEPFDIAYTLEMNEFRGRKSLELTVKDIQFSAASSDS